MEKKYKGAVFFDIDGTLVDERLDIIEPTEETKTAIATLRENGYLVGISTGRAKCYLPELNMDFDCYVTCNGAVVEINDEIVENVLIDEDTLERLIKYLDENEFGYDVETSEVCYYGERNREKLYTVMKHFNISDRNFEPLITTKGIKANKSIIGFDTEEQYEKLCEEFSKDFLITKHHNLNSADVSIFGVTKATGIEAVIKNIGMDVSDTYAFGDDANDIEMISYVGCGIVMTPHSELLEDVADMVTDGVGDGGIPKALKKLNLI